MIDRDARNKAAYLIRRYSTGHITNDDLVNEFPVSNDPVIGALDDHMWNLYDDMNTHHAKGRHRLSKSEKKNIARVILFLSSDIEYTYPKDSRIVSPGYLGYFLLNIFTLGLLVKFYPLRSKFDEHGDVSVWPFTSRKQMKKFVSSRDYQGLKITTKA